MQTDGTVVIMRRDVRTGEIFPLKDGGGAVNGDLGIKEETGEVGPVCLVWDE